MLCARPAHAEELRNGNLNWTQRLIRLLGVTIKIDQVLNGPLAEGGLSDDDAAAIVLNGACEKFLEAEALSRSTITASGPSYARSSSGSD